jgi:Astacin (Peptidase family M12A)
VFENIPEEAKVNFKKHEIDVLNSFDIEYDYDSVLHYSEFAFAIDKTKPTIVPLKGRGNLKMGQRDQMSKRDIERINKMYCDEKLNDEYADDEKIVQIRPWD